MTGRVPFGRPVRSKGSTMEKSHGVVFELRDIRKSFGPVVVLDDISLAFRRGEIHAVLGENGAGKSTLVKIMTGIYQPSGGEIFIHGSSVALRTPRSAQLRGIHLIPQDVVSVPELSVGRNILLGDERFAVARTRLRRTERIRVDDALARVGAGFDADRKAAELSIPELRLMQIARALARPGSVLLLDEPTAALSAPDSAALLDRIEALRSEGAAIVYVTHRLNEVERLADRASVLRDGRLVSSLTRGEFTIDQIVADMSRITSESARTSLHDIEATSRTARAARGKGLEVAGLSGAGAFSNISFDAPAGQIVGIAGVQGSGHSQLLATIAGRVRADRGAVRLDGEVLRSTVRRRYRSGVVLVPADRRVGGVITKATLVDNVVQPTAGTRLLHRLGLRLRRREAYRASALLAGFSTRYGSLQQLAGTLSGGNQQKLALGRAIIGDPKAILVDEPTQGIDVNAKTEVRALLSHLASDRGCSVVIATSEFEDLVGLADIVHVLVQGDLVATLDHHAQYEEVLRHAVG